MPSSGGFDRQHFVPAGGERGVGCGRQGVHRVVGGGRQLAEEPVEVGARIDASAQAAAKEAVEDGGALTFSTLLLSISTKPWSR